MINHPAIFNSAIVKYFLVTNKRNFVTPTAAYDLTIPIRSKIFSYNNFVSELDVDQFVVRPTIFTCSCMAPGDGGAGGAMALPLFC